MTETFTHYSGTTVTLTSDIARAASFDEIPLISLTTSHDELIAAVRDACTRVGFFYVRDHGVSQDVIDGAFGAAREFFAQPQDVKEDVHIKKSRIMRGYEPYAVVQLDKSKKPDLNEAFAWGYERAIDPLAKGEEVKDEARKLIPQIYI